MFYFCNQIIRCMEKYFEKFRKLTIGNELEFETPYGLKKMIYADWIASGRLYAPIEKKNGR